jgi:hypothetical protein
VTVVRGSTHLRACTPTQGSALGIKERPCPLTICFRRRRALGASLLLVACFPVAAFAQKPTRSLHELQGRLKIGEIVYVIDGSDVQTRGRVDTLSDVSLGLTIDGIRRDFVEGTISRIDRRRRDSLRNGLVIGVGSGALLGFLAGRAEDSPNCPRSAIECGQGAVLGTVGGAVWGAVAGWLIDAVTREREVIYRAPAQP